MKIQRRNKTNQKRIDEVKYGTVVSYNDKLWIMAEVPEYTVHHIICLVNIGNGGIIGVRYDTMVVPLEDAEVIY